MSGLKINFRLVEIWCEKNELEAIEVHDILFNMLQKANKAINDGQKFKS